MDYQFQNFGLVFQMLYKLFATHVNKQVKLQGMKMWKTIEEVPVEILERYKNNDYAFEVPPVFTGNWSMLSWINYIFGGSRKDEKK